MFFALNCYSPAMLREAYDRLHIPADKRLKATAAFLDVTERTLSAYLSGKKTPPRSLVYAVWHESPLGLEATSAHSEQSAHLWRTLAKSQDVLINRMKATIDTLNSDLDEAKQQHTAAPLAANERLFNRY